MTHPTLVPQSPKPPGTVRTILALMLREMSTTYGKSAMGYLWAILEPVAGLMLMSIIFSLAFRAPPMGTNFALFFATGFLPFTAYLDISGKVAVAVRFSKQLLFYPGVTFIDTLFARFFMAMLTNIMVGMVVLPAILILYSIDVILDPMAIALGYAMTLALALGVGTLNCFLLSMFPVWERTWAILNRPLFILSCVIFMFDTVPQPYRDWLWWNPLVHVVGQVRSGIYATYDANYVSPLYVFGVSMVTFVLGLILLRRYYREILNE